MFIDSRHKVFGHFDKLAGWQNGEKPSPVTIEWDLSNRCALGCMDCHFAHTHTRGPWTSKERILPMAYDSGGDLADEHIVKSALEQVAAAGVQGIVWSGGGEPTTHPEWTEIVNFANFLKLKQGMYTFGGLLTKDTALTLATCAEWVVVSLDTVDAESYTAEKKVAGSRFTSACDGISWLSESGRTVVGISFLLHKDNWNKCYHMLSLTRMLGATYATFRPAIHTSPDNPSVCTDDRQWITEALPILSQLSERPDVELDINRFVQYRDWTERSYSTCYGVRHTTVITPDGRMWMCPQRRGCKDSCLGDLRTESFQDIWARHPGNWTDFSGCRVMCRLHLMNETLAEVYKPRQHEAFL